jgi:hypothetical protein
MSSGRAAGAPSIGSVGIEGNAKSALLAGAVLLALGLAAVGVGYPTEGALAVILGLGLTILAIHFYGRLGPDEEPVTKGPVTPGQPAPNGDPADLETRRVLARSRLWRGGLTLAVSAAVTAGTYTVADAGERLLILAVPALWGAAQVFRGWKGSRSGQAPRPRAAKGPGAQAPAKPKARVEKRRRMDKSPAP